MLDVYDRAGTASITSRTAFSLSCFWFFFFVLFSFGFGFDICLFSTACSLLRHWQCASSYFHFSDYSSAKYRRFIPMHACHVPRPGENKVNKRKPPCHILSTLMYRHLFQTQRLDLRHIKAEIDFK